MRYSSRLKGASIQGDPLCVCSTCVPRFASCPVCSSSLSPPARSRQRRLVLRLRVHITAPKLITSANQGNDKWAGPLVPTLEDIGKVNNQDLNPGDKYFSRAGKLLWARSICSQEILGQQQAPLPSARTAREQPGYLQGTANYFGYNVSGITVSNLYFLGSGSNKH